MPRVEAKVSCDDKNFYIVNVGNYYKENGYIPCEIAESTCPGVVVISYGDFSNCKCAYNKK